MRSKHVLFLAVSALGLSAQGQFGQPELVHPNSLSFLPDRANMGDLNGDGIQDLVLHDPFVLRIAIGDPSGTFPSMALVDSMNFGFRNVEVFDFDVDGDIDILASAAPLIPGNSQLLLWTNNGSGNFTTPIVLLDEPGGLDIIKFGDIDQDGDVDIISSNGGTVIHWGCIGPYTYSPTVLSAFDPQGFMSLELHDLDQDGDLDIVGGGTGMVQLFWNDAGTFTSYININPIPDTYGKVTCSDMDGDQDPDIVAVIEYGAVHVFKNLGLGASWSSPTILTGPDLFGIQAFEVADFDQDGDQDLVPGTESAIYWYENDGTGTAYFQHLIHGGAPTSCNWNDILREPAMFVKDHDNDGDMDLITIMYGLDLFSQNLNDSTFEASDLSPYLLQPSNASILVDVDQDGLQDVVTSYSTRQRVMWFRNVGNGSFSEPQVVVHDIGTIGLLLSSDVDGDGDADVVAVNEMASTIILVRNVGGSFSPPEVIVQAITTYFASLTDMDSDGDDDLVCAVQSLSAVVMYENNGTGDFGPPQSILAWNAPYDRVIMGDVDMDGAAEVLTTGAPYGTFQLYAHPNTGNGTLGAPDSIPIYTYYLLDYRLDDRDGDGDLDLLFLEQVGGSLFDLVMLTGLGNGQWGGLDTIFLNDDLDCTGLSQWGFGDVTGDGIQDLLVARECWIEQLEFGQGQGSMVFSPLQFILSYPPSGGYFNDWIKVLDIADQSGPGDLLFNHDQTLYWLANWGFSTAASETNATGALTLWPDPFEESTRLLYNEALTPTHTIDILDVQGRVLRSIHGMGTNELLIERDDLASGMYVIRISRNGIALSTARVVAE